jgi:FkbM family methyltransferase
MARVDPMLIDLCEKHVGHGDVVWDIGANVGLFTFAAAACAGPSGRVVAFEPDSWLVQLLRRSARLQRASAPVDIIPSAVAESIGIRSFSLARRSRSANYLAEYGSSQTGGAIETHSVVAVSLDWIAEQFPAPNLIKIDVEGAEAEVIRGGMRLLAERLPILICEVCEESRSEVTTRLNSLGYRLIDSERNEETLEAAWSTLAIPPRR